MKHNIEVICSDFCCFDSISSSFDGFLQRCASLNEHGEDEGDDTSTVFGSNHQIQFAQNTKYNLQSTPNTICSVCQIKFAAYVKYNANKWTNTLQPPNTIYIVQQIQKDKWTNTKRQMSKYKKKNEQIQKDKWANTKRQMNKYNTSPPPKGFRRPKCTRCCWDSGNTRCKSEKIGNFPKMVPKSQNLFI